jgi:hypothetical protein
MKKITMSLMASSLLAGSLMASTLSGEVSAYHLTQSEAKQGYSMLSVSGNYESPETNGFKAMLSVMANTDIAEQTDGSYGENEEDVMVNVASLTYAAKDFSVTLGRQEIGTEWIGDYHEAVVASYTGVKDTTIVAGYTTAMTGNANDGALADFADIGEDGAMTLDVTTKLSDSVDLNLYYLSATDIFSGYGLGVVTKAGDVGITAKYAMTSEDVAATDDGSILALDLSYGNFYGGFISTDKDGGIGSMGTLGDSINPLDNADTYSADTTTLYLGASTSVNGFELGALVGSVDVAGAKDTEIDLSASWECKFVKGLDMSALYVNYSADNSASDESYFSLQAAYSF